MFRLTRTIVTGQWENDKCFTKWLEAQTGAHLVTLRLDPINAIGQFTPVPGTFNEAALALLAPPVYLGGKLIQAGVNVASYAEHRYYLWEQTADVVTPKCPNSDPDLVSYAGKNGWATQAEAQAALDHVMGVSTAIVEQVKKQNLAAVDPLKIAKEAAGELADDAGAAAKKSWPWLVPVGVGLGLVVAWKIFK